jgi:excisionase family DNA binding protein
VYGAGWLVRICSVFVTDLWPPGRDRSRRHNQPPGHLPCMSGPRYIDVGLESLGLLTVEQVAGRLTVSERTVRRLISSGQLKTVRIGRAVR